MTTTYVSEGDSATPAFMNTLLNAASGEIFNVKASAYGAAGDGSTDDTTAIQAAIDAAGDDGTVLWPEGSYLLSSGLTMTYDQQTWILHGAELLADFNGVAVTIGQASGITRFRADGGKIKRNGGSDWTSGNVGVEFLNADWCKWVGLEVDGFEKGVYFHGDADGTSYVDIFPTRIANNLYQLYFYAENSGGFVNDNRVFGGALNIASNQGDMSSGYSLYFNRDGSATVLNNNRVIGTSIECGKASTRPTLALMNCQDTQIAFIRVEGFDAPYFEAGADWSNGGNWIGPGRGLLAPSTDVDLTSGGAQKQRYWFFGSQATHIGGGVSTDPVLTVADVNSVNDVGIRMLNPSGTSVLEIGSDGALRVGASSGEVKKTFVQTTTWNPASLADGATTTVDVTVSGVSRTNDCVTGVQLSSLISGSGWHLTGAVVATDTVRVVLTNHTGGVVDLGEGTLMVKVERLV